MPYTQIPSSRPAIFSSSVFICSNVSTSRPRCEARSARASGATVPQPHELKLTSSRRFHARIAREPVAVEAAPVGGERIMSRIRELESVERELKTKWHEAGRRHGLLNKAYEELPEETTRAVVLERTAEINQAGYETMRSAPSAHCQEASRAPPKGSGSRSRRGRVRESRARRACRRLLCSPRGTLRLRQRSKADRGRRLGSWTLVVAG